MAQVIRVLQKADAHTPQRFWGYALITNTEHTGKDLEKLRVPYVYSERHTKEYIGLSEEDKKKVNFTYINGEKIQY
tara:strand:+ start:28447 stop:28674 length:228 start_codon:yes stop_codon:yes gene_type:complete